MTKLLIAALLLTVFMLSCGPEDLRDHPRDTELIERLNAHRVEFDELIQMFKEDSSLGRVGENFERTASFFEKCEGEGAWNGKAIEVDKARLDDYRERFAKLKLRAGIEGYCEKDYISLYASTRGLSVTGSTKGYAYLVKPPKLLVVDLDSYWSTDGRSFTAFRHIDGNWYLFLDYED